jgi:hypothetical protein
MVLADGDVVGLQLPGIALHFDDCASTSRRSAMNAANSFPWPNFDLFHHAASLYSAA